MCYPDEIETVFTETANQLSKLGLPSRWYIIPQHEGYTAFTDVPGDVYCLEAKIGAAQKPDYDTYAVAQVFSTQYPSLAITLLIERHRETGALATHRPTFNVENDKNFSGIFLPVMYKAFNALNPADPKRGVLVQIYNAEMNWRDLVQASVYTIRLIRRFKEDGQLAIIAVDFDDPLIRFIAKISDPIAALIAGDVHQIASTGSTSHIHIPVEDIEGRYVVLDNNSTALDEGIKLATSYLDAHNKSS